MRLSKLTALLGILVFGVMLAAHRYLKSDTCRSEVANPERRNDFKGDTGQESVKQCVERLGLDLAEALYLEEPYGQLAALRFDTHDSGWIELRLSCRSKIYSADGIWDTLSVLESRVAEVMDDKTQLDINRRLLDSTKHNEQPE